MITLFVSVVLAAPPQVSLPAPGREFVRHDKTPPCGKRDCDCGCRDGDTCRCASTPSKSCPCSAQCECGCNEGEHCRCNVTSRVKRLEGLYKPSEASVSPVAYYPPPRASYVVPEAFTPAYRYSQPVQYAVPAYQAPRVVQPMPVYSQPARSYAAPSYSMPARSYSMPMMSRGGSRGC